MAIGDFDKVGTLAEEYLAGRGGSISMFRSNILGRQRLGQAFYNALCESDRHRINGTIHDPFHKINSDAIYDAIEFLLDTE